MASDNNSGFSTQLVDSADKSIDRQLVADNICGSGSGCTVYSVRIDGLRVAVKRLSAEHRLNATYIAAYRKEFEIGRRLKHDALPTYRELRADTDEVYIVMDYVDGTHLDRFVATPEGAAYFRDDDNVRRLLSGLVGVVAYLHRSGVVHCDLKPANIMLRHSDRGVMLIDLDKAYCDTLDLTHGGTAGISDALAPCEAPTAAKDIAAIGRITDTILSCRGNAAPRFLRQFRALCDTPAASADKLLRALQRPTHRLPAIALAAAAFIAIGGIGSYLYFSTGRNTTEKLPTAPIDTTATTAATPEATPANPAAPVVITASTPAVESGAPPAAAATKTDGITDFDTRMSVYLRETEKATRALRSGKLSDTEFQDMVTRVSDLFTSGYNAILEEYRADHPEASETEVYTAMADALGSSRTFKVMQSFNKEWLDTLRLRLKKNEGR